ncbi:MAG: fumarylacetoacetate hydrolase family protein [Pelagibacteraceae bacterium]|jgi:fumarylpyruvate hydrolase
MSNYVIKQPKQACIKIKNSSDLFPVRRIYCIGRNYADHAIEMGFDPNKEPPFFFQKNPDNIVIDGKFPYPPETKDVHHELEMVVALKSGGSNISEKDAYKHIFGFAVGLDMTRRDLQGVAKKMGRPWEIGKAFEKSAPISTLTKIEDTGKMEEGKIVLKVNSEVRQEGNLNMMIWKIPEMIAHLSKFYDISGGDIIMTGTPAGVGPVQKGDKLVGSVKGLDNLEVTVS